MPLRKVRAGHRFDRARDYLHDNYMRPITLDELAQVAALSPYHFQRQFKAHYHVTPHQMLMAIRLWRAKAFLTHGMPAAEVAIAVGLTDQSHPDPRLHPALRYYAGALSEAGRQALMRNLIQYSCPPPSTLQTTVMTTDAMMISGVLYALLAGLMWG